MGRNVIFTLNTLFELDFTQRKFYEKEANNEPVLESTTENRALSLYRAVLSAFRRLHGVSAHLIPGDEPL